MKCESDHVRYGKHFGNFWIGTTVCWRCGFKVAVSNDRQIVIEFQIARNVYKVLGIDIIQNPWFSGSILHMSILPIFSYAVIGTIVALTGMAMFAFSFSFVFIISRPIHLMLLGGEKAIDLNLKMPHRIVNYIDRRTERFYFIFSLCSDYREAVEFLCYTA